MPKIKVFGLRSFAKEKDMEAIIKIGKKIGDSGFETEKAHLIIDSKKCLVVCLDMETKVKLLEYLITK